MTFVLSITDAGIAAAAEAASTGPVVISQLGLTETAFDFAPTLTTLPGEFKRLSSVAGARTGDNLIYLEAFDNSPDVWIATGCALYLDDGTLFAALSSAEAILAKASLAYTLIALDVTFAASLAANITFGDLVFTNPPSTETNRGIIEIATQSEADAGTDDQRALTPKNAFNALYSWSFKRNFTLGQVDVQTPNIGSTGGLRIWANSTTQKGILQAVSPNGQVDWGFAEFDSTGVFNWRGPGGLRAGGTAAWIGNEFTAGINVNGNLYIKDGADFIIGSQASGYPVSLIYNDHGTLHFRSNDWERAVFGEEGALHIKGPRQLGNGVQITGSGALRVLAATPGGYALTTFDFQDYWGIQFVRDINGVGTMQGGIRVTDSGSSLTTNSDYRLKEDLRPIADPLGRLRQLNPRNYKWIGLDQRSDGFIAHELQAVIPEAATGTRDGTREVIVLDPPQGDGSVDASGNPVEAFGPGKPRKKIEPEYQGVDLTKLVPLLTASAQALLAMSEDHAKQIAALTKRLAKLEGTA